MEWNESLLKNTTTISINNISKPSRCTMFRCGSKRQRESIVGKKNKKRKKKREREIRCNGARKITV